jgi:hypothetical protein
MTKHRKRLRDFSQAANVVVDIAIGQVGVEDIGRLSWRP